MTKTHKHWYNHTLSLIETISMVGDTFDAALDAQDDDADDGTLVVGTAERLVKAGLPMSVAVWLARAYFNEELERRHRMIEDLNEKLERGRRIVNAIDAELERRMVAATDAEMERQRREDGDQ